MSWIKKNKSKIVSIFFIIFFAIQLYLPASYYLGDFPWDERFAWRMFSSVRSLNCTVQAWEGPIGSDCAAKQSSCQPLRMSAELHMVWINLMKRGRVSVIEKFAEQRCANSNQGLYINLSCPQAVPPHSPVQLYHHSVDLCTIPR